MAPTPPPLHHAAFGNGRILALVAPTSAIEWLCLPRFDSPSVFGRLLDAESGGVFRVLAGGREVPGRMAYVPNTNVVRTLFEDGESAWEVVDYAPWIPTGLSHRAPLEAVRLLRPVRGLPRLQLDLDPRPDYARAKAELVQTADGLDVRGGDLHLRVRTNLPVPYLLGRREFTLTAPVFVTLSYGPDGADEPSLARIQHDLDVTIEAWRAWVKTCTLTGFAPEAVLRSALCLRLHAYHDTGAIIAAATTSIPEAMGTPRTWDYRYCWLRDAAFVVEALRRLGHLEEGERFLRYLRDVLDAGPLQPVYGIGGERDLAEVELPHLRGFGGNGHVRIGNAASTQIQNDLMGEAILCLETFLGDPRIVHANPAGYYPLVRRLVELAIERAPQPDTGIWEFRTMFREYTFSRAMCWVALDRGARLARMLGCPADADRWERLAAAERETFLSRAVHPKKGYFTQAFGEPHSDASSLLLATLGIVDAKDPRFVATVRNAEADLTQRGLMLRYRSPDDFGETTTAFTICSFWWAEALALMGCLDEAVTRFEHILTYANPVGLFSEDIDPATGTLLGNFPQAYTHVGLIHAAATIGEFLDAREGRVRAWR